MQYELKKKLLKRLLNVNAEGLKPYEIDMLMDQNGLHAERRMIERTNLNELEILRVMMIAKYIADKGKKYIQVWKGNSPIGYIVVENNNVKTFLKNQMTGTVKVEYRIYVDGKNPLKKVKEVWEGNRRIR